MAGFAPPPLASAGAHAAGGGPPSRSARGSPPPGLVGTLPKMGAVDEYFATLDEAARSAYERIRDVALAEVPGAEQGFSYGMAALKYEGKPLLGFRAAKEHLSVFPFSPAAVEAVKGRLESDWVSKGTIRFSSDHPLPDSVVVDLVRSRVAEIDRPRRPDH